MGHENGKRNGNRTVAVSPSTHARDGNWTDDERERGMVAVALCSGNATRAARELAEQGLRVPVQTLRSWVTRNDEAYQRIRHERLPELKEKLAAQHEDLARRQLEVSAKLTQRLDKESGDLSIRDVSTAQRNLDVGTGIHTQRAAELRGDPKIELKLDFAQIVNSLRKWDLVVLDSDAKEIAPALEEGKPDAPKR